jgi:hypothetical protein
MLRFLDIQTIMSFDIEANIYIYIIVKLNNIYFLNIYSIINKQFLIFDF